MTQLDELDVPLSKTEQAVMGWVEECMELRWGAAGDPQGPLSEVRSEEGVPALVEMLLRVRQRSDRVDFLHARSIQARGRAKRAQATAKFNADLAFDTAQRDNDSRRTREFVTREERNAAANLDSLEERRMQHQTQRLVDVTTEAYDVITGIHWGLDAIRKELRDQIHALQFESSLER